MSLDSFSSIISPRSLGCQKQFEFESHDIHEYIEGLEENLCHHVSLFQNLIQKYKIDSFTEDSDTEGKFPIRFDKLINEILDLYKSLKQIQADRRKEISKNLINQLFLHEHKEKLDEIIDDSEERIQEIKFHIDRRDKIIYDLQKIYNELEIQNNYKENKEETISVGINRKILEDYANVEEIRQSLLEMGEKLNFSYNYKEFLIKFYRKH